MINGIRDIEVEYAKELIGIILDRTRVEQDILNTKMEEIIIRILETEYDLSKDMDKAQVRGKQNELSALNEDIKKIKEQLFLIIDKKTYFEKQMDGFHDMNGIQEVFNFEPAIG